MAFIVSRSPLAALVRAENADELAAAAKWFERRAPAEMRSFAQRLKGHPAIASVTLDTRTTRVSTPLGVSYNAETAVAITTRSKARFAIHGSGQSPNQRLAWVISTAEAAERMGFYFQFGPRNALVELAAPMPESGGGSCLHPSPSVCMSGALCELLERDAFLTNWYSAAPLPDNDVSPGHPLWAAKVKLREAGWALRQHAWRHDLAPAFCSMVSLTRSTQVDGQWNFFIGGGASFDFNTACLRSLKEAMYLFSFYQSVAQNVDTAHPVTAEVLQIPQFRVVLFQRPAVVRRFLERLAPARSLPAKRLFKNARAFVLKALEAMPELVFNPLPVPEVFHARVFSVQAVSQRVQLLDWNVPAGVNFERVHQKYQTTRRHLSRDPHPIC